MGSQVRGVAELKRNCAALARKAEAAGRVAAYESALTIQAAAQDYAPEDTGRTKRNIEVVATPEGFDVGIWADDFPRDFYPAFIEYGTDKIPARPFLSRAFEENADVCVRKMQFIIAVGIGIGG